MKTSETMMIFVVFPGATGSHRIFIFQNMYMLYIYIIYSMLKFDTLYTLFFVGGVCQTSLFTVAGTRIRPNYETVDLENRAIRQSNQLIFQVSHQMTSGLPSLN